MNKLAQLFIEATKGQDNEVAKMVVQSAKNHHREVKTLRNEFPRVVEYLNKSAWAILPETLDLINDIVWARLHGATDFAEIEAKLGRPLNNEHPYVEVSEDGTAVIPVSGPIVKRASMFSRVSGMTSTEQIQSDIQAALDSPSVNKIHLDVDSPGGSVDGVKALSDFIFASRGKKPITAFTDGSMASAAYWISSAADEIVASDTAIVGSIGVVAQHVDYSGRDAKDGRKRTYITAGKYKRIANDAEPLSAEGLDYLKRLIDSTYEVFVEDVARNRGVSKDKVLSEMADGKIFTGREALKVGLVDRIGTIQGTTGGNSGIRADADISLEASVEIEAFAHNSKTAESEPEWGTVDKNSLSTLAFAVAKEKK